MKTDERIKRFIEESFVVYDGAPLRDDDSLMGTGRLDSTGVLELITFLEDAFGLELDETELVPENLDSVTRLTALVERHLGPSPGVQARAV
jgi:acyl carrier protein